MPIAMYFATVTNDMLMLASNRRTKSGSLAILGHRTGIGEMPLSDLAQEAFREQIGSTPGTEYLFPTPDSKAARPYITILKTTWERTLKRARVSYFPLYHLRHTFASRLSAGGVSDHFVTLMLRQGDADVFKQYSQAKLNMMREASSELDRQANEHSKSSVTAKPN